MVKKLYCKLFGHKPFQGEITWSFYAKPAYSNGEWERVTNSGPAIICSRCEKLLQQAAQTNLMINTEGNTLVWPSHVKPESEDV